MAEERKRSARKGGQGKTERPGERAAAEGMPAHVVWGVASAVVVALFAMGLAATALVLHFGEEEGAAPVVAQPSPSAGTPSAQPTASPTAVAISVDDDPAWGPEDAEVTVIEFSDYQ